MAGGLTDRAGNYLLIRPIQDGSARGDATDPLKHQYALNTVSTAQSGATDIGPDTVLVRIDGAKSGTNPTLLTLPVLGGDVFAVPEAGQAFIDGEVGKPGPYDLTHGMTLTQLISSAGGLVYPADRRHVRLIRTRPDGGITQWEVDLERIQAERERDILLETHDQVIVPATIPKKVAYGVYETLREIVRFTVGGQAYVY
jgi:hypothetical protein